MVVLTKIVGISEPEGYIDVTRQNRIDVYEPNYCVVFEERMFWKATLLAIYLLLRR